MTATSSNKRDSLWFHFTALERPRDTTFLQNIIFLKKMIFTLSLVFAEVGPNYVCRGHYHSAV